MKINRKSFFYQFIIILLHLFVFQTNVIIYAQSSKDKKLNREAWKKLKNHSEYFSDWKHLGNVKLDSIQSDHENQTINLFFNQTLSYIPIRESYIDHIENLIKKDLGKKFKKFDVHLFSNNLSLEEYVPNNYRIKIPKDENRFRKQFDGGQKPLISFPERQTYSKGLQNNNIALWHSHGWYYEARLDRWEWQRARLFGTVEDVSPMTYVLPFIAPMLENAGATTFIPRERDTYNREVIVDNDFSTGKSKFIIQEGKGKEKWLTNEKGFAWKDLLYNNESPFEAGTYLSIKTSPADTSKVIYLPDIPENGEYAVYISWAAGQNNSDAATYTIYHAGGKTPLNINQQIGGKTWIYVGTFPFYKGMDFEKGRIELINIDSKNAIVTADAIKLGGGKGNVARRPSDEYVAQQWSLTGGANPSLSQSNELKKTAYSWKPSGKNRYEEGARYFLQYSGIPFSVYSPTKGKNDYNDDYQSRGNWVNYLMGLHEEPEADSTLTGLQIPIDLSFAFHTDAGVVPGDSIIGTLGIYNTLYGDLLFPNGRSKMSSRDLTDLIQTQIIADIRAEFNPKWTRRGLWDKAYSEAWKPKTPAMLLELLSHQNLADVKFGLDPRYRFTVSRAIYKGMLRFLAEQENRDFIVQPLPPDHFAIELIGDEHIRLSWKAVSDPLEATAIATQYRVYKREGDLGFDEGIQTSDTSIEFSLSKKNTIYSFKVTAMNDGGESFPSEILVVSIGNETKKPVLIINAFDRISGPKIVDDSLTSGVAWWDDQGVPYISDIGNVGKQHDFNRKSPWLDDDNPGWGSSYADMEGKVIPGNTFDFPYIHGKAIANAGYSFVSMSNEAFEEKNPDPDNFSLLDIIFGEQRSVPDYINPEKKYFTTYTPGMIQSIEQFTKATVPVFISGAYIGADMVENRDSTAIQFAKEQLHYTWRTNHADNLGKVSRTDFADYIFPKTIQYNTTYHPEIYTVEAPDAIEPAGKDAVALFRYSSNNTSAGVLNTGKQKTVVLGFPFETIISERERNDLMMAILSIFEN